MAHVTLIRGPSFHAAVRTTLNLNALPPLGIAYIAGTVRAGGHDVTCIDASGEALDERRECPLDPRIVEHGLSMPAILDRIPAHTEIIGISCMFSFEWFYFVELVRQIRARFPRAFIVLGGEHVTADYDFILRNTPGVDACVLGEGENKMLGLVEALSSGTPKLELPGVAVYDPETRSVRKNEERDGQYRILDIDKIPMPAWDLVPLNEYLARNSGFTSVGSRSLPLLASRGCPHRCSFCSSPQMWTTRWKARSVDNVIAEIKTHMATYGINRVEFYDLTAIIDKRWIMEFCQRVIDEKLGITWSMPVGTRTEALTPEVLHLIKRSGCGGLSYPLETGSARTSTRIRKNVNLKRSLASMREAVKCGLIVKTHIIVGFPFQSYWDIFREFLFTIRLAWIGSHDTMFYSFVPYPGSELFNELVTQGTIKRDSSYVDWLRLTVRVAFKDWQSWNPRLSGPALRLVCVFGVMLGSFFQFLFRPQRLVSMLYRLVAGKQLRTGPEILLASFSARILRRNRVRHLGPGTAA